MPKTPPRPKRARSSDKENPFAPRKETDQPGTPVSPEDAHIGATEDQVSDTAAPSGEAYKDEPKQG
jgi:hypothetical protein